MATVHITRDEALKDFDGLISRASQGDEIVIEENSLPLAILHPPRPRIRLLSESLRILEERGSDVTLDGEFEKDLMEYIDSNREPLRDLWD